jgi:hypothetical protein
MSLIRRGPGRRLAGDVLNGRTVTTQWVCEPVREILARLASAPVTQQMDAQALDACQRAGGPRVTVRDPETDGTGRWLRYEAETGRTWNPGVAGRYFMAGDRVWVDTSMGQVQPPGSSAAEEPGRGWRVIWHELAHSTAAPGRLDRPLYALGEGSRRRSPGGRLCTGASTTATREGLATADPESEPGDELGDIRGGGDREAD